MEGRKNWAVWIIKGVSRIVLGFFFRLKLKTEGKENIPGNSAFVLLPKHQRWEDIPLLGLACPQPLYYVCYGEAIYSEPDISTKTLLDRAMKEIARLSGL